MKTFVRAAIGCVMFVMTMTAFAQATGGEADALIKVKAKGIDQAFLLPGADFSGYKKVIIAPSEVAFQKNWLRDMNNNAMTLAHRMNDKDANKIIAAARSGFDEIWAEAFKKAGYEVTTEPGSDVLKLVPSVFDLYVNAPDVVTAGRSQSYTVEAGEAALSLDVRDSVSGTLLGRAIDRRTAGTDMGRVQWTTSVSNRADFGLLFKSWANRAAKGLGELAQASPLPQTLQPNQKMPQKEAPKK
jgi:hypothetical protein